MRRALAIQMIINKEWGLAINENPLQGAFVVDELTDLVEAAVLAEFDRISERGGVLGAMETGYQRGRIQDESMLYEHRKHDGSLPIVGVNTFRNPDAGERAAGGRARARLGGREGEPARAGDERSARSTGSRPRRRWRGSRPRRRRARTSSPCSWMPRACARSSRSPRRSSRWAGSTAATSEPTAVDTVALEGRRSGTGASLAWGRQRRAAHRGGRCRDRPARPRAGRRRTAGTAPDGPGTVIRSKAYLSALVLAAILGAPISAVAYGFLVLVTKLQDWLFTDLPGRPVRGGAPGLVAGALGSAGRPADRLDHPVPAGQRRATPRARLRHGRRAATRPRPARCRARRARHPEPGRGARPRGAAHRHRRGPRGPDRPPGRRRTRRRWR